MEQRNAYYELRFRARFLEAKGTAFQDLFTSIMSKAHPGDFVACRPWGNIGDRKNDGYLKSERTLFQVYAPSEMRAAETIRKIEEDFREGLPYWQQYFDTWVFVHNAVNGLPPDVISKLLKLAEKHKPIRIAYWGVRGDHASFSASFTRIVDIIYGLADTDRPLAQNIATRTEFIGRTAEIAIIHEKINGGDRVITLEGPPGIGKSAIARFVRDQIRGDNGVPFVELASVPPGAGRDQVAAAFHAAPDMKMVAQTGNDERDIVESINENGVRLVVINNCEHVREPCAEIVSRLEAACGSTTFLATSRRWLNIEKERIVHIMAFDVPDDNVSLADALQNESVRLFAQSAKNVRSDFIVAESNFKEVIAICRRLDGIPLAICLAARKCHVMTVHDLLKSIRPCFQPLSVLDGCPRDMADHQRRLDTCIEWSVRLLPTIEQEVFIRLAVLNAPFDIAAAQAIVAETKNPGTIDVLNTVNGLIENGLLNADLSQTDAEYSFLYPIWEYARKELEVSTQTFEECRQRHCLYFASVSIDAKRHLDGNDPHLAVSTKNRLERQRPDIEAAFEAAEPELRFRMCGGLARYWDERSYIAWGTRWLETCLERSGDVDDALLEPVIRWYGRLRWAHGDYENAKEHLLKSVAILERQVAESGDADSRPYLVELAHALTTPGHVFVDRDASPDVKTSDYAQAVEYYDRSRRMFSDLGRRESEANSWRLLAQSYIKLGRLEDAEHYLRACWEVIKNASERGRAVVLLIIGWFYEQQPEPKPLEARAVYLKALGYLYNPNEPEQTDKRNATFCMEGLAYSFTASTSPNLELACELLGAADKLRTRVGLPDMLYRRAFIKKLKIWCFCSTSDADGHIRLAIDEV